MDKKVQGFKVQSFFYDQTGRSRQGGVHLIKPNDFSLASMKGDC
jgi:hypothetical protein